MPDEPQPCPMCYGAGYVEANLPITSDMVIDAGYEPSTFGSATVVIKDICPVCNGYGHDPDNG